MAILRGLSQTEAIKAVQIQGCPTYNYSALATVDWVAMFILQKEREREAKAAAAAGAIAAAAARARQRAEAWAVFREKGVAVWAILQEKVCRLAAPLVKLLRCTSRVGSTAVPTATAFSSSTRALWLPAVCVRHPAVSVFTALCCMETINWRPLMLCSLTHRIHHRRILACVAGCQRIERPRG